VVRRLVAVEGIVYSGTISGPIERIFNNIYRVQVYLTIQEKAGAILYSIVHGHSYADGNKRTGLLTTCLFLMFNGYVLQVPHDTTKFLERMADSADLKAPNERDAIAWVNKNAHREFFFGMVNLFLIFYCKLQGAGIITQLTPIMLEQNSIPYLDEKTLVDKTLRRNIKKKNESICEK
jgi:death-on-curing family protein